MTPRHFITLSDITLKDLRDILSLANKLKLKRMSHKPFLQGKSLAMIFEKNSTRTRISFEVGMNELGGHPLVLSAQDLQLGRGETIADTARVLSRYAHIIMMRSHFHENLQELAHYANIPVINGLTDANHPCQIMADIMTIEEHLGSIEGKIVTWAGDGNNVLHSWINAAALFDFTLRIACPKKFYPSAEIVKQAQEKGATILFEEDILKAADNADVITTDTWVSMGHDNSETRRLAFAPYHVNQDVMKQASPHAIFLHCLPAHRGDEVSADVIDGAKSVVWDEAENRLHVQKAIMCWCLNAL